MTWRFDEVDPVEGVRRWRAVNSCELCGRDFTCVNPASAKYCPACARGIRARQNRERVRRYRAKHRQA